MVMLFEVGQIVARIHKLIAGIVYKCKAELTIPEAMNEWCFLGIVFYYGNSFYFM